MVRPWLDAAAPHAAAWDETRRDRCDDAQPMAVSRGTPGSARHADHHGRRLHTADPADAARLTSPAEMRLAHAERQLHGPGRERDAVPPARAGNRCGARG